VPSLDTSATIRWPLVLMRAWIRRVGKAARRWFPERRAGHREQAGGPGAPGSRLFVRNPLKLVDELPLLVQEGARGWFYPVGGGEFHAPRARAVAAVCDRRSLFCSGGVPTADVASALGRALLHPARFKERWIRRTQVEGRLRRSHSQRRTTENPTLRSRRVIRASRARLRAILARQ